MKKKWVGWVLIGFLAVWFMPQAVKADENNMTDMTVHVQLLENGTAIITENREMTMEEGTELFIVINEDEGAEVVEFQVEGMSEMPDWDSGRSREEKSGYYGVIDTDTGKELVWGIGDYGNQNYTVSYTVTNMVRQLNDGQSLYWNFNTFGDIVPDRLRIEISGPIEFTEDNTRIWGFGYEGQVNLVDGQLVTETSEPMTEGRPAAVLMQFPNDPFLPSYYVDETLEEQAAQAEGETARGGDDDSVPGWLIGIFLAGMTTGAAVISGGLWMEKKKKDEGKVPTSFKQRKANKGLLYTDLPYKDGEISDIAYFLNHLQKGTFEQYFFAYLMKWSKGNCLVIETKEKEANKKNKKGRTTLTFLPDKFAKKQGNKMNSSDFEETLWDTLIDQTDQNNQMSNKQIQKWAEKHYEELDDMYKELIEESKELLIKEGYIVEKTVTFLGMTSTFDAITNKGQRLYDLLTQFENHLEAMTKDKSLSYRQLLPEEDFLIWAGLYGKEEEIMTRLEELLPDWSEQGHDFIPYYYTNYYGLHIMSSSMTTGRTNAGYSSTGGVGGATSFGGGGGAIGGGGGGAR